MLLLGVLSAGIFFFYTRTPNQPLVWQLGVIAFAWLCAAVCVWQFLKHLPAGELDFDGAHWYFAEKVGTVSVRFDGQRCLLLRFEDDVRQASWLWLEAWGDSPHDPKHWHDLRRAVYSRAEAQK
jgi:hypothetical protein